MSKTIELNSQNFEEEVLGSSIPVLVDFWATWCGPCKMMDPVLEEITAELEGKVKICKLNLDETAHEEIASKYQVQSIPNMKLFKEGAIINEFVGVKSKKELIEGIEQALSPKQNI